MTDALPRDDEKLPAGAQNAPRAGIIELVFGIPDVGLLPAGELRRACDRVLADGRTDALPYGANAGPPQLRALIADRISSHEGRDTIVDEVAITGGNSQAFDQVLTRFTSPGDTVLVELPTYMLAMGMVRDHPLTLEGVPTDADGLDLDALEATLARLRADGRRARMLYTIPTYHNPTGRCLSAGRRRRLVRLAAVHDLLIVEDDVYRELGYDGPSPDALWSLAPAGTVLRLGSFAKTLAPGLRVGWITATPGQIAHFTHAGMIESGGGVSHFSASVVASYLSDGTYDRRLEMLRGEFRRRRDALVQALQEHLPPGSRFTVPGGGFFVWVTLPEGLKATDLLPLAVQRGVSFLPAARSMLDGGDDALRLAFSFYAPERLAEGARRLGGALAALSAGG